ncbi:MAG: photolyase [Sphingomonas bacterium]|uniref:deoxyribodipyrimidine photo-lyase n=1 Tax=Sphingomonas bacterium TaxID=1895847 RepID=UPI00262F4EA0|nr:deoxyribodipyrimidine photo-lyase [Sphingomonas bacterium]MDB5695415.1 photolyase [Sphingomonas bacterium]
MTDPVQLLASWREAPRVRRLNEHPVATSAKYVLCWLQQALRAIDNPVIDAAVRLGNAWGLPVLVYHGVREDYPYASDRLHRFILGASRDLERDCAARGLRCVNFVDRAAKREKGLVYRLAADAAAVVLEDQPAFVAQWQAERFAARADAAVLAVNAACVVPPLALEQGVRTTSAFRRRHQAAREEWYGWTDEAATERPYAGKLPYTPDLLADLSDADLDALVAECAIDHALPAPAMFPATRAEVAVRLQRLQDEVLPAYADARRLASRPEGASTLSPYLHFGMVGPREIVAVVEQADIPATERSKFLDELLTWREWFHYKARSLRVPERYDRVPAWAQRELAEHAEDPRPEQEPMRALLLGETADETWNACQKQYLVDGWMHNNLRMYWAKRIIAMTPSPEAGWATACYLNDRLSLDGRDPSTYGNLAWAFGDAQPGYRRLPIFGLVPTRVDTTLRKVNGDDWFARAAARAGPALDVPDEVPVDPYLTGELPLPMVKG